jgi:hypothetical protein
MEHPRNNEAIVGVQPMLVYEGTVLSSAGYREENLSTSPEIHCIIGFEMIDAHLVTLLEQWRTSGVSDAGIDAYTILESFPDRYQMPTDELRYELVAEIVKEVAITDNPAEIIIHAMQLPHVYDILAQQVGAQLMSDTPLDITLQDPLVDAYLDAYAQMHLTRGGKFEALRQLYLACKSDDSAL